MTRRLGLPPSVRRSRRLSKAAPHEMDLPSPSATPSGAWPTPMAGSWLALPGPERLNHRNQGRARVPAMMRRSLTTRVVGCAHVGASCADPERATVPGRAVPQWKGRIMSARDGAESTATPGTTYGRRVGRLQALVLCGLTGRLHRRPRYLRLGATG